MVKFSKKLEYSLIALRHISVSEDKITRVRDISEKYNIPHDLLAKILQRLKKENILESVQGINGGYRLLKKLSEIPLLDLYSFVESNTSIVECMHDDASACYVSDNCTIKDPLAKMQDEFENILKTKMVSDFV
jgi:Rrf2 family protein